MRLDVTPEMGESGRETPVSCGIRWVLTLGSLRCEDCDQLPADCNRV
jgi:hypothetical protein